MTLRELIVKTNDCLNYEINIYRVPDMLGEFSPVVNALKFAECLPVDHVEINHEEKLVIIHTKDE